MQNNKKKYIWR